MQWKIPEKDSYGEVVVRSNIRLIFQQIEGDGKGHKQNGEELESNDKVRGASSTLKAVNRHFEGLCPIEPYISESFQKMII